jgi:hypothetical protein
VPPIRPLLVVTTVVEAVLVAPTHPKGDASSVGTSVPQWGGGTDGVMDAGTCVARAESWVSRGVQLKSCKPREARLKSVRQMMKEPCGVGRFDSLGWRLDRPPLFLGWSNRLGSWSDRQQHWGPVAVEARSDHQSLSSVRSDRQCQGGTKTLGGHR